MKDEASDDNHCVRLHMSRHSMLYFDKSSTKNPVRHFQLKYKKINQLEITVVIECCAFYWLHRSIPWFRTLHSLTCDASQIGILALSQ